VCVCACARACACVHVTMLKSQLYSRCTWSTEGELTFENVTITHTHKCTHTRTNAHTHTHTHTHAHMHTQTHTRTHTRTHTLTQHPHTAPAPEIHTHTLLSFVLSLSFSQARVRVRTLSLSTCREPTAASTCPSTNCTSPRKRKAPMEISQMSEIQSIYLVNEARSCLLRILLSTALAQQTCIGIHDFNRVFII